MDRPKWVDETIAKAAEEVRIALKEDAVRRPIAQLRLTGLLDFEVTKNIDKKKDNIVVPNNHFVCEMAMKIHELVDEVNELSAELNKPKEKLLDEKTPPAEEDVATIMQWHKDVFPEACFEGQTKKWEEEYGEFLTARTHKDTAEMVSELADLFIVACGIMRFNLIQGCQRMLLWNELRYTHGWALTTCEEAINKKMKKNRARKWEYMGNGNYHHVKGVED